MSSGDGTPPPLRSRTNSFASKLGFRSSRTKSDCPEVVRPIVVPSLGDSFSSFASAAESPRAGHSPRVSDSPRTSFPTSPPPPKPSQTPSPPVPDASNRRPPPPPAAPKPLLRGSPVPGVRSGSFIISTPRRMSNPPGDSENLIDQVVASSPPSHRASSSAPRSVTVHFPSNELFHVQGMTATLALSIDSDTTVPEIIERILSSLSPEQASAYRGRASPNLYSAPEDAVDHCDFTPFSSDKPLPEEAANVWYGLEPAQLVSSATSSSLAGTSAPATLRTYSRAETGLDDELEKLMEPDPDHVTELNVKARKKIVAEILCTEIAYVQSLKEMAARKKFLAEHSNKRWANDCRSIFGNVQQLLDVNEMLLAELETRITQDWHDQQVLGDIFVKFVPFLKMYTIYSSSYDEGLQIYLKMKKSDSKFSHALDEAQAAGKEKMDLEHLLIMPVQRVPRYNLLLRDLRKMTPVAHPEWPLLNKALAQTLEVSKHINIGIRQAENLKVLAGASSRGKGFTSLLESHRQLIRDVVLTATSKAVGYQIEQPSDSSSSSGSSGLSSFFRSGTQKVHFYLFNDLFLWAPEGEIQKQKDISKVSESAPLNLLWIFKKKKGIEVIVPGQSFTFKFENNAQKTAWEKDFDQTCGSFLNTHSTAQTNLERNTHPLTHASEWRWAAGVLIDGGTYDGWFHNGARSGQGHYNIMGNDYHGEWLGGRRHGQGTATYFTGDSYTGQWADNQPHGHGVWTGSSGDTYVGEHRANLRHGKGTFTWASGDVYEGDWVAGQANGRGKYRLKSGLFYEGHFENSRFHGQGKLSLPSNLNYAGFWKNGRRHGQGQCDFGNGTMYNGDWVDDLPSGKGAYVSQWANARFAGTWQAGVRHGKKCTMVYGDGSTYLGDFKDDLRSGKGEYLLPNGTSVSGKWRNDKLHGNCIVQYKNGVKLEGLWENGFREGKFALTNVIDTSVSPSSSSSSSPAVLPPITLVFRHSQLISHPAEAFSAAAPIHPPTFTINPIQTFFSFTGAGISSW